MKTKPVRVSLLVLAALIAASCGQTSTETQRTQPPPVRSTQTTATPNALPAQARVPAYYRDPNSIGTLPPTLSPARFIGPAQDAYRVAQEIPQTLAQLPCYCHCDMSMGHKSLHSCFEDMHASQCAVCVSEALEAYNLQKSGLTPSQIRDRIISQYSQQQQ